MRALSATGGVLTSAGIILAGTFLILLSQPVKDLAEISIGVAIGVLLDTFLVRTALVPGLTLCDRAQSGLAGAALGQAAGTHPGGRCVRGGRAGPGDCLRERAAAGPARGAGGRRAVKRSGERVCGGGAARA